jgi:hypothetical protein
MELASSAPTPSATADARLQDAFRAAFTLRGGTRTVFLPLAACRAFAASAILRMSWPDALERASRAA